MSAESEVVRSRRPRRSVPKSHPNYLVGVSVDLPRWLLDVLEDEVRETEQARGYIISEWLEQRAVSSGRFRRRARAVTGH